MDLISVMYFTEVVKDANITRTAERLFLSQQTLSNHMARLESELGTMLFVRRPAFSLTPAGEQFLNYARTVTREYANLQNRISDIEKQDRGTISFGASTLRMSSCLPAILPRFHERFPNVEIRIADSISRHMVPRVIRGELDMAIVILSDEIPVLETTELMEDRLYLCVSDSLLAQVYGDRAAALKERSVRQAVLKDFAELPYCLYSNILGNKVRGIFEAENIIPRAYITSTYTQIGVDLCLRGLAACVASQMNLTNLKEIPPDLNIFPLYHENVPQTQELSLIWRKDRYLSVYAKFFIELLTEYFRSVEARKIIQKV